MAQMWSHLDLTSQAALSQVRHHSETRMDPLPEVRLDALPEDFENSWEEMDTDGTQAENPQQQR